MPAFATKMVSIKEGDDLLASSIKFKQLVDGKGAVSDRQDCSSNDLALVIVVDECINYGGTPIPLF